MELCQCRSSVCCQRTCSDDSSHVLPTKVRVAAAMARRLHRSGRRFPPQRASPPTVPTGCSRSTSATRARWACATRIHATCCSWQSPGVSVGGRARRWDRAVGSISAVRRLRASVCGAKTRATLMQQAGKVAALHATRIAPHSSCGTIWVGEGFVDAWTPCLCGALSAHVKSDLIEDA
jgi:hypothetical protein